MDSSTDTVAAAANILNSSLFDLDMFPVETHPVVRDFVLRKARFYGEIKWIKVPTPNNTTVDYHAFVTAAKQSFELGDDEDIVVRDEDGAVIDSSIFELFPKTVYQLTPKNFSPGSGTTDTVSISLDSSTSTRSQRDNSPARSPKKRKIENSNLLQEIKNAPGGIEVIEEYQTTGALTGQSRRKLVNIAVNLMVSEFGHHPTAEHKLSFDKD